MIGIDQYFGKWRYSPDCNEVVTEAAAALLSKVNALLTRAELEGVSLPINPTTHSNVSGTQYGGFRPQACPEGAPSSSHKVGRGVDVYDPLDSLDDWLTDELLEEFGLYREHPSATVRWCHLTDRPPYSHSRTFMP
jgi:hypothetical protein